MGRFVGGSGEIEGTGMTSREFIPIRIAVLTVSDTRLASDDKSGDILVARTEAAAAAAVNKHHQALR